MRYTAFEGARISSPILKVARQNLHGLLLVVMSVTRINFYDIGRLRYRKIYCNIGMSTLGPNFD
jgi:hypothetical protein